MKRKFLVLVLIFGLMGTVSASFQDGSLIRDGFEDGECKSDADWNPCGTYGVVNQQDAFNGTYGFEITASNGNNNFVDHTLSSPKKFESFRFYSAVSDDDGTSQSGFQSSDLYLKDGNGNRIIGFRIAWEQNGFYFNGNYYDSVSVDTWYDVEFRKIDYTNNEADLYVNGSSIVTDASFSTNADNIDVVRIGATSQGGVEAWFDDVTFDYSSNTAPSIDSVSTSPSSWTLNSDVNVSANVSDSDGSVSSVSADVWENGTQIVNDASLSDSDGDGTWEVSNLFTVDKQDVYYNYTLTATDNDGATSTYSDSQFISDDPPEYSLNSPVNETRFDYDDTIELTTATDDGDNIQNENYTCTFYKNGNHTSSTTLSEGGETFTENLSSSLGTHTFVSSCKDDAGNTKNKTREYTVKAFQLQNTASASPVYETANTSYTADIKIGDMVNQLQTRLYWNNEKRYTNIYDTSNTVETVTQKHYFRPPLVNSNATQFNWKINYQANYTEFQSTNTTVEKRNSSSKNQDVWHSFYLKNHSLDKNKYIERDTAKYTAYLYNKTSYRGLSQEIRNNLTQGSDKLETSKLVESDVRKYNGTTKYPAVDQKQVKAGVNSVYNLSFRSSERQITTADVQATVHQITFQKCSKGGEKALVLETFREGNLSQKAETVVNLAVQVFNPEDPSFKRTVNTSSDNTATHNFCIEPGYAEYQIDNTKKLLQYEESNNNDEDFALRSYFIQNETINNDTTTIPLYTIRLNKTSRVGFEVLDSNDDPQSGIIVKNERYFPSKDSYIPVSMIRTGSAGTSETFLEVNEIYYRFKVYDGNNFLQEEPDQIIPSDLQVTIRLGDQLSPSYFDFEGKVSHSCISNLTAIECSYTGPSSLENISLKVEEDMPVSLETRCITSSTSSSGTLQCTGLNTSSSRYKYSLTAENNDGNRLTVENGWLGELSNDFGDTGVMISLLMFVTMSFAGLWRPSATVMLGMLAMVAASITGFVSIGQTALISLLSLGAVLIWRMS